MKMLRKHLLSRTNLTLAVLLVSVSTLFAQRSDDGGFRRFGGRDRYGPRARRVLQTDRAFSFCRLMFTSIRREAAGSGWRTDYPNADINFMIRVSELTKTPVSMSE